jgi:hypothetical protein
MRQSDEKNVFMWPQIADIIFYNKKDVQAVISEPEPANSRYSQLSIQDWATFRTAWGKMWGETEERRGDEERGEERGVEWRREEWRREERRREELRREERGVEERGVEERSEERKRGARRGREEKMRAEDESDIRNMMIAKFN